MHDGSISSAVEILQSCSKPSISTHDLLRHIVIASVNWRLIQYIPRDMHTVFALLCFVVVIHWLIFPYPSGLLHCYCGNLTIAPVSAKQPWWIWINTSREFIMNDCITTTKQSTTKPCAYFLGYTVGWYRGFPPAQCQAIIRTNVSLIFTGPVGTNSNLPYLGMSRTSELEYNAKWLF